MSDSLRPHEPQPTRLLCPWDFPGKSAGVGAISQIRHNYTHITSLVSLSVLPLSHLSELSHRAKLGTLCYIATSHLLSILHMVVYIYFNANFCIHPTLSFPHRVHTTQSSNHTSWYLPSGTQNLYPCKTST